MSQIRIATRYAKALLELSIEKNSLEAVFGDMKTFLSITSENRELAVVLANPIVNYEKKFNILKALLGKSADKITMSFFDLITRKNRSMDLVATAREFLSQYNEF